MVRSEGLEPPRFYSLPPQGSASTNSATSAFFRIGTRLRRTASRPDRDPINGADVTNQRWRDKACERGGFQRDPMGRGSICLTSTAIRLKTTTLAGLVPPSL